MALNTPCRYITMGTSNLIKNKFRNSNSKDQQVLTNSSNFGKLLLEIHKCFSNDWDDSSDGIEDFSWMNRGQINRFGYDINKGKKLIIDHSVYRKNRLRHKLIRIQKEFEFVKNNIDKYHKLTRREKEIMQLLAKGCNNPIIATQLFISRKTVEHHRKHINCKLNIKSFSNLMKFIYAFDLV